MGTKSEPRHEAKTGYGADEVRHEAGSGEDKGGTGGNAETEGAPRYRPVVMKDMPLGVRPCSIAGALEVLGEKWSLVAMREMAYGVHRFAQIVGYTGAPRDILTDRLRKLEAAGIIERRLYNEHPPRHEYHLTPAGRELFPVMISLLIWGDKWAVQKPAVLFRHTCGEPVAVNLTCAHCGEAVTRPSLTPFLPTAQG